MLQRIPENVRKTFSLSQIQAIEDALVPRTHKIDIRWLMPAILGQGAYLVLSAGPNKRSSHRPSTPGTAAEMPHVLADVIALSQACQNSPNAYRLLGRLSKDISSTFTLHQIRAIEAALIPRSHFIDIRLSMPFLGKGAYFVFAAGPNKRKHYRNLQNKNPFVMPAVTASIFVSALAILGLVHLRGSKLLAEPDPSFAAEEAFHPTVVPFKKNRGECEESGRQWVDDQCIDETHDPVF
ncbi:MAG: hypothetical protein AAFU53_06990 [Cyanobacteria bacterium J06632_3]